MIDYSLFKHAKVRPAVVVKHEKHVAADAKLEKAYRKVEEREFGRCQVTGVELLATSSNDKVRREHHHLAGRRVQPSWRTASERIILVSAFVHALLTSNALLVHGTDARKPIYFSWNPRIIKPGKQPFRLRPEITKAAA